MPAPHLGALAIVVFILARVPDSADQTVQRTRTESTARALISRPFHSFTRREESGDASFDARCETFRCKRVTRRVVGLLALA